MTEKFQASSMFVERYAIWVTIPLQPQTNPTFSSHIQDLFNLEIQTSPQCDVKLLKVRALIKYAELFNGKLEKMYNKDNFIKLLLSFSSIEKLLSFRDTMEIWD